MTLQSCMASLNAELILQIKIQCCEYCYLRFIGPKTGPEASSNTAPWLIFFEFAGLN